MMNLKELIIYGIFKMNSNYPTINFKKEKVIFTGEQDKFRIVANSHNYIFTFNTDATLENILCSDLLDIESNRSCKIYCTENELKTYIPMLAQDYFIYLKDYQLYNAMASLLIDISKSDLFNLHLKISVK